MLLTGIIERPGERLSIVAIIEESRRLQALERPIGLLATYAFPK